jgi:peptidoglycan/LPS O-acetylase OafA/YrhL
VEAGVVNLQDRLDLRANNFDVLRLFAASLVLFSHCYPLTGHAEPFAEWTGVTLGEVGVVMFFAMSGFLIAKSWLDLPRAQPFALKRALRLLPALVVATAVTTLIIGPLFTDLSLGDYLTDPLTWLYLVRASLLVPFGGHLPGVFEDNVFGDAVNGSLWTLPVEASCYVLAALLGLIALLRRSSLLIAAAAILLVFTTPLAPIDLTGGSTAAGGNLRIVVLLGATFVLGAGLYALRARLRLSWIALALLAALWVLTFKTAWVSATTALVLGFGVLVFAFRTPASLRRLTAPGDVSYGIYVYAFPVQQSVAAVWGPGLDPLVMLVIAFPLTYGLALGSWRLIERPALSRKPRSSSAARPSARASTSGAPISSASARIK